MNTPTLQLQRQISDPLSSRQSPRVVSTMLGTTAVSDGRSEEASPSPVEGNPIRIGEGAVSQNLIPNREKRGRRTTTLSIASLNTRGLHGSSTGRRNKLNTAVRVMRDSKWGILGLQETHESNKAAGDLETANPRTWAFPNPGTAFSAGTMIILYQDFFPYKQIRKDQVIHKVLIQGRAHMITLPWREGENIDIVNIYAPNDETEATRFFKLLGRKLRRHPDILMGDFNHVENPIDRIPQRDTAISVRDALTELRTGLGLSDGWRLANPGTHSFTWTSASTAIDGILRRSRLDRILTSARMTDRTVRWKHQTSQNLSDHDFVYVDITDERDPEMGTSRWRLTEEQLQDKHLDEETLKILVKAEKAMNQGKDAMKAWLQMKASLKNIFTEDKRRLTKLRSAKAANLASERDKCKKHPDYATNIQIQGLCEALEGKIADIAEHKTTQSVLSQTARYRTLGESVTKYWFSIGKSLMTESMIRSLKDEDGIPRPFTDDMLEIAAKHHEKLMKTPEMTRERTQAISEMVDLARKTRLTPANAERLATQLSESETELAIRVSQNGKAPGADGITYEFYKKWAKAHKDQDQEGPRIPSIINMMTRAWNAPSRQDEAPEQYVQGIMALMYKKGDKELTANYRPITLLNTDEKLETKCLATRMGLALPAIIHPDQAGFVPGRDILDQVKLAKLVAEYCEVTEQDGCLVALDQEKAYDRIDHEYLWKILEAYGIPEAFIRRVKALYVRASTQVMINRKLSRPFQIRRGVRQGDPMSCLLFDLAIEPLAELLRTSDLKGIRVPGQATRLVCKLFADDTQLYLAKNDSLKGALSIAEKWTIASTAKFNEGKTEILPMGSPAYRKRVTQYRKIAGERTTRDDPVPAGTRIVEDGETLRILGGQVGYRTDLMEIWQPALDKMSKNAKKWSSRPLTMKGRTLVCSFLILSIAQYKMMVNEPPKEVITKVDQILRTVIWKGKSKGILTLKTLSRPAGEGGLGLPLFEARVRAARIMWLKKWRKPATAQPQWTAFLERLTKKNTKVAKPWMKSILDQTWKTRLKGLTKETQNLMKEATTSNLTVDALKMGPRPKLETLIWRSSESNKTATDENSSDARRLWNKHGVNTQAGLIRIRNADPSCRDHIKCIQAAEKWMLGLNPKSNILEVTPVNRRTGIKDNLDHTTRRTQANVVNRTLGNPILLNPSVTHHEARVSATRVFAPPRKAKDEIAYRQTNLNRLAGTTVVYTDGSADRNGYDNSACGAGLWSRDQNLCAALRIPGYPPTNNRGELAAITIAMEKAEPNRALLMRTDSMYVLSFLDGGFTKLEDRGWINTPNADLLKRCLFLLRRRTAETWIQKVKAHSGDPGNEAADEAAKKGCEVQSMYALNLDVPDKWALQGAKLSTLTFHDAYEWTKKAIETPLSDKARENLERCAIFLQEETGNRPATEAIWLSTRDPAIRKEISDFLWQALHGRTVCGPFFRHWGGEWTERQYCVCGALETLEHILCGCQEREWRSALWQEFRKIGQMAKVNKAKAPPIPQYEEILTIGLTRKRTPAETRLYKILATETVFQIWKSRNSEVIRGEKIHPRQAINALHGALHRRAQIDLTAARLKDNPLRGRKNYDKVVKATWAGLIRRTQGKLMWIPSDHG